VGQQDVDAVAAQARAALLSKSPHHAVIAVVEHRLERRGVDEAVALANGSASVRDAAAADLGRDHPSSRPARTAPSRLSLRPKP
jgi:hypothetical protein